MSVAANLSRGRIDKAAGADFPLLARRLFGNVRLDFAKAESVGSRLVSASLGPCRLSHLSAGRHSVHGERVSAGDAPDMVKLIVQKKGYSKLHQSGRQLKLGPTSVVLYDPVVPYLLVNPEAVDLLMLQIPRGDLPPARRGAGGHSVEAALTPGSALRVLSSMMEATMADIDSLDESARLSVGRGMLQIVRGMLDVDPLARDVPHSLDLLNLRIKDYVAANLGRPALGAPDIARRVGCSLRYVYKAFEIEGVTPAEYIWSERLRIAAERLSRQPLSAGLVSDIAFSLGFSSSAHFSRAFRSRYQQSPTEWSRSAREPERQSDNRRLAL